MGFWGAIKVIGLLFTLFYRPKVKSSMEEPKPGELSVQTSTRGMPIAKVYGRRKVTGNLLWYDNFQSHRHYDDVQTGKGGGGGKQKVLKKITYSVSCAFGVCIGPATVLKIWKGKDEITNWADLGIVVYSGTSDQAPNSHLASFVPRAPAYRNLCYVVFENFNLGQTTFLPNFSFEVISGETLFGFKRKWVVQAWKNLQWVDIYENEIYVVQIDQHKIVVFDLDGTYKREWGSQGSGDGEMNYPHSISVYNDEAYVADTFNHRIQVFDLDGTYKRKWGFFDNYPFEDGGFYYPSGIVVHNDEVYVADSLQYEIEVFDLDGTYKRQWGEWGSGDGEFDGLAGITIYNNEVYVLEFFNYRVQVFDLDGTFKRKWGSQGSGDGEFSRGYGIYVYEDEVYVCDSWNHRIQVFDLNGTYKRQWGGYSRTEDGKFDEPYGIAAYDGEVFVCDSTGRVQVFGSSAGPSDLPPTQISLDILTNNLYGLGGLSLKINTAAFSETEQYCIDEDLLITAVISGEISVADLLQNICAHHNGYITYLDGIAHKQIKAETITETVDVDTDVLSKDPPVEIDRDAFRDIYNSIRVKYTKRSDLYSLGIERADDEVHQTIHGLKDRDVQLSGYTNGARAAKIAHTILRRSLKAPMQYLFTVGPKKALSLIQGSVFALTDNQLGLSNVPLRILSVSEAKDNKIEIKAIEEIDFVMDAQPGSSSESWTPPLLGGDPGSVRDPMVVELPPIISNDMNLVAIGFSDSGEQNWCGATVYDSFDDTTYESKQSVYGCSLTGMVDSVTADKVTVTVTDEDITLQGVADVFELLESLNTNLCWVKESNAYFRFAKATLIAPGQWELEGMIWNVFRAPVLTHNISAGQAISFIRYKQEPITIPYDIDRRGSSIYYKIVSFNFFGEYEDISLITPEQITFESVGSRPIAPQNFEITGKGNIAKVGSGDIPLRWRSCNRLTRGLDYERSDQIQEDTDFIRFDIVVKSGVTTLRSVSGTDTTWTYTAAMQAADGSPSAITFEITKICNKNKSFKTALDITIV